MKTILHLCVPVALVHESGGIPNPVAKSFLPLPEAGNISVYTKKKKANLTVSWLAKVYTGVTKVAGLHKESTTNTIQSLYLILWNIPTFTLSYTSKQEAEWKQSELKRIPPVYYVILFCSALILSDWYGLSEKIIFTATFYRGRRISEIGLWSLSILSTGICVLQRAVLFFFFCLATMKTSLATMVGAR